MSRRESEIQDTIENRDRIHVVMFFLSYIFLFLGIGILACIIHIQATYHVDEKVIGLFRPTVEKYVEAPVRGKILATDGRPMAISAPLYDLYMDCTVKRQYYKDKGKDSLETLWRSKARELGVYLSNHFRDKSADQYARLILQGRDKGNKYLLIKKNVDLEMLNLVKTFPLYKEGTYTGGLIAEKHEERIYPYDTLARRTIGYVKDISRRGIEDSFDSELHGHEGYEWRRVTDNRRWVRDLDSAVVAVQDGNDVRTTLNVDFQDMADKALRAQIRENPDVRAGICVIMETKTGAIRAMVNLSRETPSSGLSERENLVLSERGEQGSVMKTATLLSLVEDGHVKRLDQTLPTNNGWVPNWRHPGRASEYPHDDHISDYQRKTGRKDISVMHGFEISSNYVFAQLAETYYGKNPQELFDHLYSYRLGEAFDFDIEGLRTPSVVRPGTPGWSNSTLGTVAYGYGLSVTPLHVVTFYNGIANHGRMMKPYLVESIEKDGKVLRRFGPSALNESICSPATADTVTRALKAVVNSGTGARLKGARLTVAGKTGTARIVLPDGKYQDAYGRKKNQGTFVGFFPADDPKYTILVTVYSYLSAQSFYGGTMPALAVRDIVDQLYALDPDFRREIHPTDPVPQMNKKK